MKDKENAKDRASKSKEEMKEKAPKKYSSKMIRARMNNTAEKMMFGSKGR